MVGAGTIPDPVTCNCTSRGSGTLVELNVPSAAATEPVVRTMAARPGMAHNGNFTGNAQARSVR
jgi:hypothetical protein